MKLLRILAIPLLLAMSYESKAGSCQKSIERATSRTDVRYLDYIQAQATLKLAAQNGKSHAEEARQMLEVPGTLAYSIHYSGHARVAVVNAQNCEILMTVVIQ